MCDNENLYTVMFTLIIVLLRFHDCPVSVTKEQGQRCVLTRFFKKRTLWWLLFFTLQISFHSHSTIEKDF